MYLVTYQKERGSKVKNKVKKNIVEALQKVHKYAEKCIFIQGGIISIKKEKDNSYFLSMGFNDGLFELNYKDLSLQFLSLEKMIDFLREIIYYHTQKQYFKNAIADAKKIDEKIQEFSKSIDAFKIDEYKHELI